jgi:hypothetical protein
MRVLHALVAVALGASAGALDASPAAAQCSVFDRHPCNPTNCSVFQRRPCLPQWNPAIGQDLRLTIESANAAADAGRSDDDGSEHKLDTLSAMFDALRACWVPPPQDEAREGMQISVRFSFKRSGEIIGTPRVTYVTPGAPRGIRDTYQHAVTAALERCTPLPVTAGLGGAIAGRPIAIRFVDNRTLQSSPEDHQ